MPIAPDYHETLCGPPISEQTCEMLAPFAGGARPEGIILTPMGLSVRFENGASMDFLAVPSGLTVTVK
jgi:hypothetical protein